MKMFLNLSIKNKLILIILMVTTITIGIGFTVAIIYDTNTYKKEMIGSTIINAQLISEYCIAPLTFKDQKEATTIIENFKTIPSITACCIYNENGNLFASFQKVRDKDIPLSITTEEKYVFGKDNLKVFYPIKYKGIRYGTVYIKASTDLLSEKINQHLIIMISLMFGLIILSYFIASKFQTAISKPILNLAHAANKITQESDYSLRVQKQGADEIGLLYNSFNEMLTRLNTREEERNKAVELLKESEAKNRRIVDTTTEGIWVLGPDHITTFVNARMVEMLGYSSQEMNGRPLTDFMFDEDIPDHLMKMEDRRQGLSGNYERRFRRKEGQTVWTLASATSIIDDEHHFMGSFAMFTDITERKLAEEALKKRKDELEKFEKLTVSRELKMIELKKRIAELETKLLIKE